MGVITIIIAGLIIIWALEIRAKDFVERATVLEITIKELRDEIADLRNELKKHTVNKE